MNCGGHVVRIMRAGQVSSVLDLIAAAEKHRRGAREARPVGPAGPIGQELIETAPEEGTPPEKPDHHWHLSDLLHPFQHRNK
jgi:hypothetical protein